MNIHNDSVTVCTDCAMFLTNGDLPEDDYNPVFNPAPAPAPLDERIAAQWGTLAEHIHLSYCPTGEDCEHHDDEEDCRYIEEFSWSGCDGCGSPLGGRRWPAVVLCQHEDCNI